MVLLAEQKDLEKVPFTRTSPFSIELVI